MVKATIVTSQSGDIDAFNAAVGTLQNTAVYVGIPDATTGRKRDTIGPHQKAYVTNAGLLYIHTNGSQLRHIPARPVIEPAIEESGNRLRIESLLHQAATLALDGKKREANHKVKMCGQFASNAAKLWFTDPRNGWAQNAPDTIRRKLSKLKRKGAKANKKWLNARTIVNLVPQYMPQTGTTALDSINTPLIDTAQLRRAITYVTKF